MISVHAVGDIGVAGKVAKAMEEKGFDFPFIKIRKMLKDADIVFGNLEIPFQTDGGGQRLAHESRRIVAPPKAIECLKDAGFNVLSIANNHIMDLGDKGLQSTISLLTKADISYVGAGVNIDEARKPLILNIRDTRVGILAYAMNGPHSAHLNRPGAAPMDEKVIQTDIKKVLAVVDTLIVSLHFGMIYADYPTTEQQHFCHALIDSGVSLIIGHHPHILQGIEVYGKGVIAYSLGEFIFDATVGNVYAKIARNKRRNAMILNARIDPSLQTTEHDITHIKMNDTFQSEVVSDKKQPERTEVIERLSLPLNNGSLSNSYVYEKAGQDLIPYQLDVYLFHLKKLNFTYIIQQLLRIRKRHIRLIAGFLKSKLMRSLR